MAANKTGIPPISIHLSSSSARLVSPADKARDARKAALRGVHSSVVRSIRTTSAFRRPKTLRLPRTPKYARTSVAATAALSDAHAIIRSPMNTESAMRKIEDANTLTFLCDPRANKHQIKAAVQSLYGVRAARVRTLNRPDGVKKAYVRLPAETDASDVAGKIGFI